MKDPNNFIFARQQEKQKEETIDLKMKVEKICKDHWQEQDVSKNFDIDRQTDTKLFIELRYVQLIKIWNLWNRQKIKNKK